MRRFVILAHDWPHPHFDFMLEEKASLRTWRLAEAPQRGRVIPVEEIAPHRLAYLEYEGPVSGERGTVTRWDFGTYLVLSESDDPLTFDLRGRKIQGIVQLVEQTGSSQFDFSQLSPEEAVEDIPNSSVDQMLHPTSESAGGGGGAS